MQNVIEEIESYEGKVLGRLVHHDHDDVVFHEFLEDDSTEDYDVAFVTRFDDQILIHCVNGTAFRY
jgi:hypothetical protein